MLNPNYRRKAEKPPLPETLSVKQSNDPVRRVITPSKQTVRTSYPSTKAKRSNDCESGMESKVAACLEVSPGVASWASQPMTLRLLVDGQTKKYTPDFKVDLKSGRTKILEVKPLHKCLDEIVKAKLQAAHYYFRSVGISFEIITDEDLGSKIFHQNLNLLRYYKRVFVDQRIRKFAQKIVTSNDSVSISDLEKLGLGKEIIYSLLACGEFTTDLNIAINPLSTLTVSQEIENENCLFKSRSVFDLE